MHGILSEMCLRALLITSFSSSEKSSVNFCTPVYQTLKMNGISPSSQRLICSRSIGLGWNVFDFPSSDSLSWRAIFLWSRVNLVCPSAFSYQPISVSALQVASTDNIVRTKWCSILAAEWSLLDSEEDKHVNCSWSKNSVSYRETTFCKHSARPALVAWVWSAKLVLCMVIQNNGAVFCFI